MNRIQSYFRISVPILLLLGLAYLASGSSTSPLAYETTSGGPATVKEVGWSRPTRMAEEKPDVSGTSTTVQPNLLGGKSVARADEEKRSWRLPRETSSRPIWLRLEKLTPPERKNALIELELPTGASQEALSHAEKVEGAWNRGEYEYAIELFKELGRVIDIRLVAVGIGWRTPVASWGNSLWGDDVRIGPREGIYNEELDFDALTGNLFAAVILEDSATYYWTVNISTDGGATWRETHSWAAGYPINDMSATVSGNHFWVSYSHDDGGGNHESARLRRHFTSDGTSDAGYGWHEVFDKGSEITDLDLSANADYLNNRVYYSGILQDGTLALFWDDTSGVSFTEVSTGITNAERGLDSHWNQNFSSLHTWFSWINTADSAHVAGWSGVTFTDFYRGYAGPAAGNSSVGCYGDTVLFVYEHDGQNNYWIRYNITYNGGSTWLWGVVGDTTMSCWAPHITGRMNGGFHVVYEMEVGEPDPCLYTWRLYAAPPWTTPVEWNDYDVTTGAGDKPRIEWVPGGYYGGIYTNSGPEYCYFDRSDWFVGVVEQPALRAGEGLSLQEARPNPFRSNTIISFTLPSPANMELTIHDAAGRRVAELANGSLGQGSHSFNWDGKDSSGRPVPSGMYFYRLTRGSSVDTGKIVLVR